MIPVESTVAHVPVGTLEYSDSSLTRSPLCISSRCMAQGDTYEDEIRFRACCIRDPVWLPVCERVSLLS